MIIKKFEEAVERNPGKEAIKTNNRTLTYAELNFYANRVAHSIAREDKAKETGAEKSQVALLFDYGIVMIAGALGALKANKAYVPLDISYPGKRLLYILENSETYLILTDNNNLPLARELSDHADHKIGIINIETIGDEIPGSPIEREVSEDRTAYILYTSGSTGKPKGVFQIHRNVLYYTRNWIKRFSITEYDRMSLFTSFTHDGAVQDIFSALLSGALIYPYSMKQTGSVDEFYRLMAEEKLTVWHSVPSLYRYFASTLTANDRFTSVRWVLLGGEPLRAHDLELYKTFFPNANFANVYGQTESSVTGICAINMENTFDDISLGEPLDETKILLLDEDGDVVEEMGGGEIVVDCDYIAPGYWKDKENTEKVFLHDEKRGSLYRTGDMGRFTVRGSIKVLGRKDFQVKIRGFRIELGEIETELLRHYAIKEAIVIARPDENNDTYLCAYIVPGQSVDAEDLREYLSSELPDYMTPRHFIFMEKMPLNSSGKIDRMRLPEPEKVIGSQSVYAAPTNEIEEKVVEIWQKVLKVEKIGINDNFTELGGHSLMIISIISKIHQVFNVELRLTDLFENPTIKQLSRLIMESKQTVFSSIEPMEEKEYYGVTSNQKSMLILNQFEGIGTTYNLSLALKLEGDIDVSRIEEIFRELVDRQESFRTSFRMIDNEWVQVIHREVDFGVQYIDVEAEKVNDNFDIKKIKKSFIRPFDLEKAPSIRVGIATLSANECLLIIDTHHIISDGASGGILSREFSRLYSGEQLPGLRLSYKDYSEWQSDFKKTDSFKLQEQYWLKTYLEDVPTLDLPNDFPRPPIQSYEGGVIEFFLEKEIKEELNRMVKEKGATLFMVLLAMYNVLLHKYTSQDDIITGTIISGRPHVDLENIVGFFAQTLALRNRPTPEISFTLFLEELKENTLKAYENQMYPFNELVGKLNLTHDHTRNPLFDSAFVMLNADMGSTGQPSNESGIKATNVGDPAETSLFDIYFLSFEIGDKISCVFKYNKKIFKKETMERFVAFFKKIVSIVLADPDVKLSEIEIISEEEKRRILYDFNDTERERPKDKTIHRLFEEQVERTPDQIAIVYLSHQITYGELNGKSGRLAHELIERGIKSGGVVGVKLERSVEMLIGIMGILKSGAAYLPIDIDTPQERVDYMLKDSNTKIIIDKSSLPTLNFSTSQLHISVAGGIPLTSSANTCYVIYTSGSTGKPKGVMIEHRSVINFIKGITERIPFTGNDRILSLTTISFDIFGLETLLPLVCGSAVVMGGMEEQLNPVATGIAIEREKVSILQVTPSRLQMIISLPESSDSLKILKFLLVGGEIFPGYLLEKVRTLVTGRIFNMYGPTETTIWSTVKELSEGVELNIGKPIANTQIYIIDNVGNLQPLGIAGELCIGGAGLARGYLNRPQLTSERFVVASNKNFCGGPGGDFYKTGDLARWLGDGNIEFLGRKDFQVKIRGFRIELEEIENYLRNHESIVEVAAFVKESGANKYLCAAIVADGAPDVSGLRHFLSGNFPEYMIPSRFVRVEKIPLNSNGKVDRKALQALKDPQLETGTLYVAPETEREKIIAQLWQEVLKLDKVGVEDNFFDLGGNSMDVILLNKRLNEALGVNIPVVSMFRYTTIQSLMRYLNDEEATGEALEAQIDDSMSLKNESMSIWDSMREE